MPEIVVEDSVLSYSIRHSTRARRIRLVVKPDKIEVVAPIGAREERLHDFVDEKRHWVHRQRERLRRRAAAVPPRSFVSGARILFRGRWLRLWVEMADIERPSLRYATAFHVAIPRRTATRTHEELARREVVGWLKQRALKDAREFALEYEDRLGVAPAGIRLGDQKTRWGSCGRTGVIHLNWRLIAAPKPVYEYVVVHELCHLRERNHGPRFWRLVAEAMPDYRARRRWLRDNGPALQ
jgi:predicted metal-dependent hydrolase